MNNLKNLEKLADYRAFTAPDFVGTWACEEMVLPLKVNWKLSRNETLSKTNFLIKYQREGKQYLGEVAPNIRYGESSDKIKSDFALFVKDFSYIHSMECASALKAGIYGCLWDQVKEQFISLTPYSVPTSFSIPIMDPSEMQNYLLQNTPFPFYKLKVNAELALELVKEYFKYSDKPLRVDGNEAWDKPEDVISFLEKTKSFPIAILEQPMSAKLDGAMPEIKKRASMPIYADESITANPDWIKLKENFDGVNVKIMKAGGIFASAKQITEAKKRGLQTMIGCMIETGLGISQAYSLAPFCDIADLDGHLLLQENPFDLLVNDKGYLSGRAE